MVRDRFHRLRCVLRSTDSCRLLLAHRDFTRSCQRVSTCFLISPELGFTYDSGLDYNIVFEQLCASTLNFLRPKRKAFVLGSALLH